MPGIELDNSQAAPPVDPFQQADNDTEGVDGGLFGSMFIPQGQVVPADPYASTMPQDGRPLPGPNDRQIGTEGPTLFTDGNEVNERPQPANQQQPVQQQQGQQPYDPRLDPKRLEYHQSRADRYRTQVEQVQPYIPIIEYLQNDPEALRYLETRALGQQNGQPAGVPAQAPAPALVAPTVPEKPATYNVAESLTPGTESFRYREALEKYQGDRLDYMEKMINQKDQQQQQAVRSLQQQRQVEQMMQGVRQTLQAQYNAPVPLVEEFIQRYSDPRSVTLDNLWKLFQLEKNQSSPAPQRTVAQGIQQERNQRQRIPVPFPGSGNAPMAQQPNPNDKWNADVLNWDRSAVARMRERNQQK